MTLLTELLLLRETRFESYLELFLKNIELQMEVQPYLPFVSINVNIVGFNEPTTNEKLIELLIDGGLKATLNVGIMNTSIDFDLSHIDKPNKQLNQRLSHYRTFQLNKLYKLVVDELKKQISAFPSIRNVVIDVYKVTAVSNQETTDYIVQTLKEGGLEAKAVYNTIHIVLPDLSYKRPSYTLNEEEKRLLNLIINGEDIEHSIRGFLLAIFNYLATGSKEPIKSCLSYANVFAFMQTLVAEKFSKFLGEQEINIAEYKCDLSQQIPCSLEEWRHCDDLIYIMKAIGDDDEFKLAFPLFNYLLTQI
jgi:hypothetical protein